MYLSSRKTWRIDHLFLFSSGKPERGLPTVMCLIVLKKFVVSSIDITPYHHGKVSAFRNSRGKSSNCVLVPVIPMANHVRKERKPHVPQATPLTSLYELLFCFSTATLVGLTIPQLHAEIQRGDRLESKCSHESHSVCSRNVSLLRLFGAMWGLMDIGFRT